MSLYDRFGVRVKPAATNVVGESFYSRERLDFQTAVRFLSDGPKLACESIHRR